MWRASALCFNVVVFFVLFLHWYQKCTWIPITHKKAFKTTKCLLLNRQHCKLSPSSALARWPGVSCTCGAERRLRVTARGWSGAPAVARRPLQLPVSGSSVSADVSSLSPPAFVCSPRWRLLQPPEFLSINVHYRVLVLWCQPPPLHLSLIEMMCPLFKKKKKGLCHEGLYSVSSNLVCPL